MTFVFVPGSPITVPDSESGFLIGRLDRITEQILFFSHENIEKPSLIVAYSLNFYSQQPNCRKQPRIENSYKGQLISKCPFWRHHFDQNTNKIFLRISALASI